MDIKKIKIQPEENFDNFRISLLHSLKLFDYNKDCLIDFDSRIKNYFDRNKNLKVEIEVDKTKLYQTIYNKKFWNLPDYKQEIPENYPMHGSNMECQAYYDPIVIDPKKHQENIEQTQKQTQLQVNIILAELDFLNRMENIEIKIKNK
ncbi:hypothetical protein EV144_1011225 [Flavobacterium sp. 270]|uniref:hypothetical protein n=1 Tax=Flavobacterium sp. 270 TaxID=2512114 RepID=UPI001064BD9C|nr:hypothetical protein [Flavobacterium sp. 270]TDW52534.1 hypothetical protein EV144_1011225 [Flavobacterium sp. 270]